MTGSWRPDPTARHELRWHDGASWTDHVADAGEVSTDEFDSPKVAWPDWSAGAREAASNGGRDTTAPAVGVEAGSASASGPPPGGPRAAVTSGSLRPPSGRPPTDDRATVPTDDRPSDSTPEPASAPEPASGSAPEPALALESQSESESESESAPAHGSAPEPASAPWSTPQAASALWSEPEPTPEPTPEPSPAPGSEPRPASAHEQWPAAADVARVDATGRDTHAEVGTVGTAAPSSSPEAGASRAVATASPPMTSPVAAPAGGGASSGTDGGALAGAGGPALPGADRPAKGSGVRTGLRDDAVESATPPASSPVRSRSDAARSVEDERPATRVADQPRPRGVSWWVLALVALVAFVAGGVIGYALGVARDVGSSITDLGGDLGDELGDGLDDGTGDVGSPQDAADGAPIELGGQLTATSENAGIAHTMSVATEGAVTLQTSESDFDTVIDLYDDEGELVATDDDGGTERLSRLTATLAPGTYTVVVRPFGFGTGGVYTLTATAG